MGAKNLDRLPFEAFVHHGNTVGDMIRTGWEVRSVCQGGDCAIKLRVSLPTIAKLLGEDFSLWNRTSPCKRYGCHSKAYFEGKPRGMNHFNRLVRSEPLPDGRP